MKLARRQRGVVLLLIVLTMLAIGGVALFASYGAGTGAALRNQQKLTSNAEILAAARAALFGYAVNGTPGSGNRPGQLPTPDTLQNTNYDGSPDASSCLNGAATNGMPALSGVAAQVASLQCVGRLPWKSLGLSIDGASESDVLGIVPWYAVSQNLAEPNPGAECMTVLNPSTAAASTSTFACGVTAGPAWPWLKVCDATGKLLSDRVAFVIIIPGPGLQTTGRTQARINAATVANPQGYGYPGDFLDAIPTPGGPLGCTTFDNAALNGEFVIAPTSATFNDQLIFVTIDELMLDIERRVANEVREGLTTFKSTYGSYPWLPPIGNPTAALSALASVAGTTAGFVPFHTDTSATSQKFMTELAWNINSNISNDLPTPAGSNTTASTEFNCGGGPNPVCKCRPRTTTLSSIARTVTDAQFTAIKDGSTTSVTTPAMTCSRDSATQLSTRNTRLTCDVYSYTLPPTPVTYAIQRRSGDCTTGSYSGGSSIGNYSGMQTRTITITLAGIVGTGTATLTAGSVSTHARRSFSTASGSPTNPFIEVTDLWQPDMLGVIPFDLFASTFPSGVPTGKDITAASGTTILSNIRVYPDLPKWYFDQKWYESMYASFSPDVAPTTNSAACTGNCFTSGTRTNIDAVVISAGAPLAGQNRYGGTPTVSDFLEAQNTMGTSTRTFDSSTKSRNSTYADTVVTIPK